MQSSSGQQGQQTTGGDSYISANPGLGVQAPSFQNPIGGNPGGAMGQTGMPGSMPGMMGAPGAPGAPALPGFGSPSPGGVQAGPTTAASLINDLLTRPNPQGAQIVQQALQSPGTNLVGGGGLIYAAPANGAGIGGGAQGTGLVAGIASASKSVAIMVYDDHSAYNEWEFIFDPAKVTPIPSITGSVSGMAGQAGNASRLGGVGQSAMSGVAMGGTASFGSALAGQSGAGQFGTAGTMMAGQSTAGGTQMAGVLANFGQTTLAGTPMGQPTAGGITGGLQSGATGTQGTNRSGASGGQSIIPTATLPPIRLGRP
jgi:hypothetical protein